MSSGDWRNMDDWYAVTDEHDDCQQCCGCLVHPIGKPWGWNSEAWDRHWRTVDHPDMPRSSPTTPAAPSAPHKAR